MQITSVDIFDGASFAMIDWLELGCENVHFFQKLHIYLL